MWQDTVLTAGNVGLLAALIWTMRYPQISVALSFTYALAISGFGAVYLSYGSHGAAVLAVIQAALWFVIGLRKARDV